MAKGNTVVVPFTKDTVGDAPKTVDGEVRKEEIDASGTTRP